MYVYYVDPMCVTHRHSSEAFDRVNLNNMFIKQLQTGVPKWIMYSANGIVIIQGVAIGGH